MVPQFPISSPIVIRLFDLLLKHLLGLVDLGGQVGGTATIGVVVEHERAVLLAEQLLGDAAFAIQHQHDCSSQQLVPTYGISRIKAASRRVILGSKPPL